MEQKKSRTEVAVRPDTGTPGAKLLRQLEEWLAVYDHIFLVPDKTVEEDISVSGILRAGAGKTGDRKFLLLSASLITESVGFTYRQLMEEEQEQFLRLYYMYEFSDRFSVISRESAYGGLFHLVETGLLSMDEAAQALFAYR